MTQPGMPQAGVRSLPGVVAIAGGLVVEAGVRSWVASASPVRRAATRMKPAPRLGSRRCATKSSSDRGRRAAA